MVRQDSFGRAGVTASLLFACIWHGFNSYTYNAQHYSSSRMIRSFACPETEKPFNDESSRRLPKEIQRVTRRKLLLLNQARSLIDLRVPYGNHLAALKDDRKGQHSIRVNDQWRVCFRWQCEAAFDVEIVDYH